MRGFPSLDKDSIVGQDTMRSRKSYFNTFFLMIIICLLIAFFLIVVTPNNHREPVSNRKSNFPLRHMPSGSETFANKLSQQASVHDGHNNEKGNEFKSEVDNFDDDDEEPEVEDTNIQGNERSFDIKSIINKTQRHDDRLVYKAKAIGLTFYKRQFFLSKKPFRIFSGSIHYFRLLPEHWRDRLLKLKACGLNTVETYVPWNLHEPRQGSFNFEGILNIRAFLKLAQELGLYVILRPGPYVCSEIDFGGLPGWLLEDVDMKVRSNHGSYLRAVKLYFDVLLPKVVDFQYTRGGPIIMVQVENEYAVYGSDIQHLKVITYMLRTAGIQEMLVTSDNSFSNKELYFHKYALPTSNADQFRYSHYDAITGMNEHFPFMMMELWTGWFDSWGQTFHSERSTANLITAINQTMHVGGSFNLYMFHGGTNFGFLSGAVNQSKYSPFVTSYDYDALLTEAGDVTPKYKAVRNILAAFYKTIGRLEMRENMPWISMFELIPASSGDVTPHSMESYPSFGRDCTTMGYIVYSHIIKQHVINPQPGIQMTGYVRDRLLSILNGHLFHTMNGPSSDIDPFVDYEFDPHFTHVMKRIEEHKDLPSRLDLVVENLGRVNYSPRNLDLLNNQRKGLNGPVFRVFSGGMETWQIRFLNFGPEQLQSFSASNTWSKNTTKLFKERGELWSPTLFRTFLDVVGKPEDTFVRLEGWTKGVVAVNNFVLGRYWKIGPQHTLYLPGPLLKQGQNEIMVFEEEKPGQYISFEDKPDLGIAPPLKN